VIDPGPVRIVPDEANPMIIVYASDARLNLQPLVVTGIDRPR
jgi:hypothetical protein